MLALHVEKLSDLAVVECKGRVVSSDNVFQLRDVVMAQIACGVIVLDLDGVDAIGGGGLGILAFLERWASNHNIQFKLFNPSKPVVEGLVNNRSILNFEIASFHDMMGILMSSDRHESLAA